MRKLLIISLLIMFAPLALAAGRSCWLAPKPLVLLRLGVEGGIAPRPATFQLVVLPEGRTSRLYLLRHQDGKAIYTQGRGPSFAEVQQDLAALYSLPQEKETGLADPYRMSVALHTHDGDRCWANEPPTGCVRGPETVTPNAEQKAVFAAAVKRLEKLGAQATAPLTEQEYQAAFGSLFPPR